jgi:hypothetical protein
MEKEVLEAYERLVSAFREGRDKFGSFADEATIVDGGQWFGSLAEYRAAWDAWTEEDGPPSGPRLSGDAGHEPADARGYRRAGPLDREPGSELMPGRRTEREIETIVFGRQPGGRWLIVHSAPLAAALRKLLDEGYSMTDLGRELGITRQAVHDLLRRAKRVTE